MDFIRIINYQLLYSFCVIIDISVCILLIILCIGDIGKGHFGRLRAQGIAA